jgi:hypothetical protein
LSDTTSGRLGRIIRWGAVSISASLLVGAAAVSGSASSGVLAKAPQSGSVLVARALRAGTLTLPHGSSGAISRPGAPNATVLPNVKASGNGADISNENPIAADPSNPLHLLSGGNDYNCSALQGFYSSDDGGATWRSHCLPVVGAGGCGDPNVAYDTQGNSYILGIGDCDGFQGSIVLQKSNNNGVTWGTAKKVIPPLFAGGITDKEWTEIDHSAISPFKDRIYTSITQFDSASNSAISVSRSSDGGNTFTTKQVDVKQSFPTSVDQFSDLAIAADGTVYVTWIRCPWQTGPTGDCGGTTAKILMSKSTDGGVTWSPEKQITTAKLANDTGGCGYGCFPGTFERQSNIPVIDVDDSTGKLWVAYYHNTGTNTEGRIISSSDGGTTWGTPVAFGTGGNQGWIWLSTNDAGAVAVTYMNSTQSGKYTETFSGTRSDGATFVRKTLSSVTLSFANDGFGGGFIGDYTGNVFTGTNVLHASWMDTRNGTNSQDFTGGVSFP